MGFFKKAHLRHRLEEGLEVTVEKSEWFLGYGLKGTVSLISTEEFNVEGIWVWLRCTEHVKRIGTYSEIERDAWTMKDEGVEYEEEYWDSEELYSDYLQVVSPMRVFAGEQKEYAYVMKIPSVGRETYHGIDRNVEWTVSLEMKVKELKNSITASEGEILVAKAPVIVSVKEVVREVVLIPCAYCGGLMPQTSIFCPNCGARRKG